MIVLRPLLLAVLLFGMLMGQAREEVRIGVLAKSGAEKALVRWEPTADYLNGAIPGYRFRIVPMDFDEIPMLVQNRLVDFVIVNPAIYVSLAKRYGVSRIATMKDRGPQGHYLSEFGSVLFTRKAQEGLVDLDDLKGHSVAAVHSTSLGGWILVLEELKKAAVGEKDLASLGFLGTHDAVVEAVAKQTYDAGIVRSGTLERMDAEGSIAIDDFRIIHPRHIEGFPYRLSTTLVPEWPIGRLEHVPRRLAKAVALALMQMDPNSAAAQRAAIEGWTIPESYVRVEGLLKGLHLPPFEDYGKVTLSGVMQSYGYGIVLFLLLFVGVVLLWSRTLRLNYRLRTQQRALSSSEEMFKGTFEQAAVGLMHVTLNGEMLRFNRKICTLTGYSAVEFSGKNLNAIIATKDLPASVTAIASLKRGERNHFAMQARLLHANGHEVWTNLTVSAVKEPGAEAIKYLILVVDDISELKALEQNIISERHAKALVLDMAGEGILGLDKAGNHTFVNPAAARMLGYGVEEMIGRDSHAMWHHTKPDGTPFPSEECPIATVLEEGIVHRGENELLWCKDGSGIRVDFTSTPIVEEGKIVGAVVVFRTHEDDGAEVLL